MELSQRTVADYIKQTDLLRMRQRDGTRFAKFSRDRDKDRAEGHHSHSLFVHYQSLHGLDVRRVDGQGLFIPAFGFIHVASELGDLSSHVQHVVGCGEEVGSFLCAG